MKMRLLELCRSRDITFAELSRWTGIARVSLSRYAHGAQDMTLGQLFKIVSCLGCSLNDLVDDREDLTSSLWQKAIQKQSSVRARRKDKSWVPRALLAATQRQASPDVPYENA